VYVFGLFYQLGEHLVLVIPYIINVVLALKRDLKRVSLLHVTLTKKPSYLNNPYPNSARNMKNNFKKAI